MNLIIKNNMKNKNKMIYNNLNLSKLKKFELNLFKLILLYLIKKNIYK